MSLWNDELYPNQDEPLERMIQDVNKDRPNKPISCMLCNREFNTISNLNSHLRHKHKQQVHHPCTKQVKCGQCSVEFTTVKQLVRHFRNVHKLVILEETFLFDSEEDFMKWRNTVERETASSYVKKCGVMKRAGKFIQYLYCHRSGDYSSKGCGKRRLKLQGSNKMGSFCPSHMKVTKHFNGSIEVCFIKMHFGHDFESEHLSLAKREKVNLKIKFEKCKEEVREQVEGTINMLKQRFENATTETELDDLKELCMHVQIQLAAESKCQQPYVAHDSLLNRQTEVTNKENNSEITLIFL